MGNATVASMTAEEKAGSDRSLASFWKRLEQLEQESYEHLQERNPPLARVLRLTTSGLRVNVALLGALVGVLALVAGAAAVQAIIDDPQLQLAVGVILVVTFGALGLIFRGVGEVVAAGRIWKAIGYFMGAVAYGVTATVALNNGLPILLGS